MGRGQDNLNYYLKHKSKLLQELNDRGIYSCELRFDGCTGNLFCNLAHRHKRLWYIYEKELLVDINQVLYICNNCHQKIENDSQLTEEMFKLRRPNG